MEKENLYETQITASEPAENTATEKPSETMGLVSFILGILALVNIFTLPCGILGIVFGCMQRKKVKTDFATAGIILSAIALARTVLAMLIALAYVAIYLFMFFALLGSVGM